MKDMTDNPIKLHSDFTSLSEWARTGRPELLLNRQQRCADLPLKYWNQQAHFTTPASGTPEKAIRGLAAVTKILDRFSISAEDIAGRTGAPLADVELFIHRESKHSPFVMVDAEDAVALTEESGQKARNGAVRCFTQEDWGSTLPFFRPSGLALKTCVDDLLTVLPAVAKGRSPEDYPIAGIVWPKTEHPEEIEWVCSILKEVEAKLGLQENQIKFEFLVESGYALSQLREVTQACVQRLAGIIWGIADYSADTNLPRIENAHPVCDWARCEIVNMAGAVNVPAIDCMTLNYPTPLHRGADLTGQQQSENKDKILDALQEVYQDSLHGIELGMTGKWVGHPLQLLMVMVAYHGAIPQTQIARDLEEIEAYHQSVAAGAGAAMLGTGKGEYMADRATDRHLRARLRRAAAWGALDAARARELDIITASELNELQGV
jgi:citrate lyase beta subunit